ncbi:hypothetical protein Ndes2526B_g02983 [Nannochloris sp. 'desiccata']|nr:hypothetical protein KSW81_006769 [Chlorella desiccata (nom. nud.)]KAH7622155.1 putative DNA-directed RNA polymerases II, IV and V subunit 11 [Chlorella desiccata (nom. nud.)]
MSNAPDRYEKFVVPEGVLKIDYQKDTKLDNSGTFVIQREDHTIGNMLRTQLHRDSDVIFAGYKIPHPLEYQMLIRVRTSGKKPPAVAVQGALTDLKEELSGLKFQFQQQAGMMQQ